MSPSPTDNHQKVLNRINFLIFKFLEDNPFGELRIAPYDVHLDDENVFQPDILFIRNDQLSTWKSFFGAYLVASWEDTDFALLRLNNSIKGHTDIAMAGWDRSSTVPTMSTLIHHPMGDVKKITVDNGASTIENSPPNDSPYQPGTSFKLTISNGQNGDDGLVEDGSSGSP